MLKTYELTKENVLFGTCSASNNYAAEQHFKRIGYRGYFELKQGKTVTKAVIK